MISSLNTTAELERWRVRMAILPVGATEQHSSHLPLATDSLITEAVASRVAGKLKACCLPLLPYSISHMHRGSRGTVWLRNSTLTAVIRDIAGSLRGEGFSQIVLLNGHGGNFILVPIVQDLNFDFPDLLTLSLNIWEPINGSGLFPKPLSMVHGDEFETSCILYLRAETVRRGRIRDRKTDPDLSLLRYLPFSKISRVTHTGKPTQASAEIGKRALDVMVRGAVRNIRVASRKMAAHRKSR